jgi:predicted metal-dependent phosphoesterase TrpH
MSAITTIAMIKPVDMGLPFLQMGLLFSFPPDCLSMPPTFDLQSHSIHSDGALPAADVIAHAAAAGTELVALTDHDTIDGVPEARAAAAHHGIAFSAAAELSAVHGAHEDLHILGYGLDDSDQELQATLHDFRGDRARRIAEMADRLRELGFELDDSPLEARRQAGKPIGRPHLADAVLAHPGNAKRLADEGIDGRDALFPPYLIPGAAAYVARSRPTVAQAIEVIHAAGGVAVWAHPFWDVDAMAEVEAAVRRFAAGGMDGVEAFYIEHGEPQTALLCDLAEELDLLTTGSADFHGPHHPHFSRFRAFELYGREPRLGPI